MNEWKGERGLCASAKEGLEGWRKREGSMMLSLGRQRKGGRTVFFFPPGFPVGVKWGKEQQKVGSWEGGSVKEAVRRELTQI